MFLFKQKTAYEMSISDWSSDVCSSDLASRTGGTADSRLPDQWHLRCRQRFRYRVFGRNGRCVADRAHAGVVRGSGGRSQSTLDSAAGVRETARRVARWTDRKSVVEGKSVSVRVDPGGARLFKKKT